MAQLGIKDLLEAGVHFGHQTRRWNPRMRRYIHGERDGIHIIDLLKTERLLTEACEFAADISRKGGTVLFVGTKKQARDSIEEWAERCGMPYVSRRWLGGLLTNWNTISKRIDHLHELVALREEGRLDLLPTKERMQMESELAKLEFTLGGVRGMKRPPDAVVVIDLKSEAIAVREADRLRIPIIGLVDTNCDPQPVQYVIPGNDDAIRSCSRVVGAIGSAIAEARQEWEAAEAERRRKEEAEAERRRAEEDERRRKEEEEAARAAQQAEAEPAEGQAETTTEPSSESSAGEETRT